MITEQERGKLETLFRENSKAILQYSLGLDPASDTYKTVLNSLLAGKDNVNGGVFEQLTEGALAFSLERAWDWLELNLGESATVEDYDYFLRIAVGVLGEADKLPTEPEVLLEKDLHLDFSGCSGYPEWYLVAKIQEILKDYDITVSDDEIQTLLTDFSAERGMISLALCWVGNPRETSLSHGEVDERKGKRLLIENPSIVLHKGTESSIVPYLGTVEVYSEPSDPVQLSGVAGFTWKVSAVKVLQET